MRTILMFILVTAFLGLPIESQASGPESGVRSRSIYGVSNNRNVYGVRRNSSNIFGVRGLNARAFGSSRPNFVSRQRDSRSNYIPGQSRNQAVPAYELHPMTEAEMMADSMQYEIVKRDDGILDY